MILVLPAAIYVFALTYVYGSVTIIWLDRFLAEAKRQPVPLPVVNITGLIVLAEIAGYLSLFMKIGLAANIIVLLMGMALYLGNRNAIHHLVQSHFRIARSANKFAAGIFFVLCGLVLIEAVDRPKVGDTGLYHLQTIKWIASYGVVPGLGNLHGMYALNSMWYPLSALFGFAFLGIQSLHIVNGMLFLFAVGFFLGGVTDLLNGSTALSSIVKAVAFPFSLFAYKPDIGSPSTDLPVALLIWITFILCLENVNPDQTVRSRTVNVVLAALIAYVLTVKLAAIPMAMLYLYLCYLQYKAKRWADLGLQIGLGVAILAPWLVRNVILSGYLVYPFPYIDLFKADWKMPYDSVIAEKRVNHGWARLPDSRWKESLDMPLAEWIPEWLKLQRPYKLTIVAAFLLMPVYLAMTLFRMRGTGWKDVRMILYGIACSGVIFWFANAPDPRFGFGFIFIALVIPIAPFIQRIVARFRDASSVGMLSILILYLALQSYRSIRVLPKTTDILWAPVPYPIESLWSERLGNRVFYGAMTGFCWDAPLPCTPILNRRMRPRGDNLESGFRIDQTKAVR